MSPVAAGLLVFVASGSVLVLEILAGRLLAPYVGVTLETYTAIIGTVLAGISLGSWLGGRAADRIDPRLLLGPLVVAGGILGLIAPTAIAVLGQSAEVRGGGPVGVVALALIGFFAPAAVLSAVTPTVVKLQLDDLSDTGTVVGRLAALGTAGAIVGTFVTGFLLIAQLPSRAIVLSVGGGLVAVGVVVWVALRPDRVHVAGLVALAGLAAASTAATLGTCEYESPYFCARVVAEPDDPSRRLLLLDTVRHSFVDVDDPTHLEFTYSQTLSDVVAAIAPPGEPIDALHVGGGGFTMPRYLAATRPGSTNVVLELDAVLVRVAHEQLGLEPQPGLDIRVGDARVTLPQLPEDAFDLVIGDAFGGLTVPWHLTTREFLEQIAARLRPGGVYAMNLIDYPPNAFARAEVATMRQVFDHVAVLAPPARLRHDDGGNFIVVGSDAPIPVDAILARNTRRGDDEAAVTGDAVDRFVGDAPVLTDAYAPVDQLMNPRRR
ncbi:MAG: fused MFS/spermidine synthase [Actinomycetota bacterium]|nr:fused MFS/spermidine synthase [Actinomycetota bacterium]